MKSKSQMMVLALSIMAVPSYCQEVLPFPEPPSASLTKFELQNSLHSFNSSQTLAFLSEYYLTVLSIRD